MLAAARGRDNARIAADLRISADTVRKWRGRLAGRGLDGLADLPRSGRSRRISELTRAAVVALACQLPAATGVPLSRWTGPELPAEITRAGLGRQLSLSSVLRILAEHPVKPWQYQSWISPRAPDSGARASVILDLYQGFTKAGGCGPATASCLWTPGRPSRPAAAAAPPPRPRAPSPCGPGTNTPGHGALTLLAALDVHTGKVLAATPATAGIVPFMDLMSQVMSLPQYKDAPRVSVIADNGSDHRGQAAVRRLHDAWPNAIMIHTPVHAYWLNQAEIFFSITQKKAISPNDFASLDELAGTLPAFVDRYNQTARPFNWKFTAADLARLLDRISAHEHAAQNLAELPEAA